MTLTPERHQRFVSDLTSAFGDTVDAIEVGPDMVCDAQYIRVRRGKAWAQMSASDYIVEDIRILPTLIERVVTELNGALSRVLTERVT